MKTDFRPIGVFDSGIGGLTVLKTLALHFPEESFVYLGDTARLPYGSKSPETIRKYSEQLMDALIKKNVKALVIACNSASSQVHEHSYKNIPVYNVILPGAKTALHETKKNSVVVLGTRATIQSHAYLKQLQLLNPTVQVLEIPCPLFVPLAEEGLGNDPITELMVRKYLSVIDTTKSDVVIMGCTHYPILKSTFAKIYPELNFVDSGNAIANWLDEDFAKGSLGRNTLAAEDINKHSQRTLQIFTTDASDHFNQLALQILHPLCGQIETIDL